MRKHLEDCVGICRGAGLSVHGIEHRRRHVAVISSKGPVFFPCTPSDRRWRLQARAVARRLSRTGLSPD